MCRPFFFLLLDSFLESLLLLDWLEDCVAEEFALLAAGVATAWEDCAGGGDEATAAVVAGAEFSGAAPSPVVLLSAVVGAVGKEVIVDAAGCAAGAAVAAVVGAAMIWAPVAAVGVSEEEESTDSVSLDSAFAPEEATPAARLNLGPAAPWFRTSVAETVSSGGFKLGWPTWAAK